MYEKSIKSVNFWYIYFTNEKMTIFETECTHLENIPVCTDRTFRSVAAAALKHFHKQWKSYRLRFTLGYSLRGSVNIMLFNIWLLLSLLATVRTRFYLLSGREQRRLSGTWSRTNGIDTEKKQWLATQYPLNRCSVWPAAKKQYHCTSGHFTSRWTKKSAGALQNAGPADAGSDNGRLYNDGCDSYE